MWWIACLLIMAGIWMIWEAANAPDDPDDTP